MAEVLARWVRVDIVPVLSPNEAHLVRLQVSTAYDCRPRNRVESAPMSEHGTGNAIDVRRWQDCRANGRGSRQGLALGARDLGLRAILDSTWSRFRFES